MVRVLIIWAGNIFLGLLLSLAAFLLIAIYLLGWQFNTVVGGSMDPALKEGEIVMSWQVEPESIAVGDIVIFHSSAQDMLIVHRVVEKQDGDQISFATKGDANSAYDRYLVPAEDVVGKIRYHVPLAGYVFQAIKSPVGLLGLMVVLGLMIMVKGIGNIRTDIVKLRDGRRLRKSAGSEEPSEGFWQTGLRKQDWVRSCSSRGLVNRCVNVRQRQVPLPVRFLFPVALVRNQIPDRLAAASPGHRASGIFAPPA